MIGVACLSVNLVKNEYLKNKFVLFENITVFIFVKICHLFFFS